MRFVAIGDDVDTDREKIDLDLMLPMKNIFHLKALLRDGVIGMEELDEFSLAFRRELSREMKEHLW